MSWLSEKTLFLLVKCFYRTKIAQSAETKEALVNEANFDRFRAGQIALILEKAQHFGISIAGKDVLDLGCNDGAITAQYSKHGARRVYGVDIDPGAIAKARRDFSSSNLEYLVGTETTVPLPDSCVDVIICYDVFEHVAKPAAILKECKRILRLGGSMLIGTWGWYHPFAPHLWATMPVPWAHVVFSEKTMLRVCRRVFHSAWYIPNMYDLDENGRKRADKYQEEAISTDYLNKHLISDFEALFDKSGFRRKSYLQPFGSKLASWTRLLLKVPLMREFFTGYLWSVLIKEK